MKKIRIFPIKKTFLMRFSVAVVLFVGALLCPPASHAQGGVALWTNRFDGPAKWSDYGRGIAVDASGNVFVTGESVGSGGDYDYATVKYSAIGMPLWTNRYDGPAHHDDRPIAIAVDDNGSVFVTGGSESSPGVSDYLTLKYSSGGMPLWTNRYDGPHKDNDAATAMALDKNGNVFVTGLSRNATSSDFATIKYSNAGVPLWTNFYDGPLGMSDIASAIAVDGSGNAIVTGTSFNSSFPNDSDYATIKYSPAGDMLWVNRYDGPNDAQGNSEDQAHAIAVDSSGNVFVTGHSFNGSDIDYATIAYSSQGVPLWTNRYNSPGNGYDFPAAIAVGSDGDVLVTGGTATIKYSAAGVPLWTRPGAARAMALDSSGNVFVTGASWNGNNEDYLTASYSNAGVPIWTNYYNGPGNGDESPSAITVDRNGNVFVTGFSTGPGGDTDYLTIKYSSSVPPPRVAFRKLNDELVLSWTNAGFNLQTAPAVTGRFTNVPAATSPYTNLGTAPQRFFRLRSD